MNSHDIPLFHLFFHTFDNVVAFVFGNDLRIPKSF